VDDTKNTGSSGNARITSLSSTRNGLPAKPLRAVLSINGAANKALTKTPTSVRAYGSATATALKVPSLALVTFSIPTAVDNTLDNPTICRL